MKFTLTLTFAFLAFTLVTAIKTDKPVELEDITTVDEFRVLFRYSFSKLKFSLETLGCTDGIGPRYCIPEHPSSIDWSFELF